MYGLKPEDMQWIETTESSDGGKLSSDYGAFFLPKDFPIKKRLGSWKSNLRRRANDLAEHY